MIEDGFFTIVTGKPDSFKERRLHFIQKEDTVVFVLEDNEGWAAATIEINKGQLAELGILFFALATGTTTAEESLRLEDADRMGELIEGYGADASDLGWLATNLQNVAKGLR